MAEKFTEGCPKLAEHNRKIIADNYVRFGGDPQTANIYAANLVAACAKRPTQKNKRIYTIHKISRTSLRVLEFLKAHQGKWFICTEIAAELGLAKATANEVLARLFNLGRCRRKVVKKMRHKFEWKYLEREQEDA